MSIEMSMGVWMDAVKRQYDSSGRRDRAARVGAALLETAHAMLLSDGYASTTIPRVAQACDVSVDSVYKRFPGKPALVRAVVEQALRGGGAIPAETRSDAVAADDLPELLQSWGRLSAEVSPRVAPLLLLVRHAAEQDPSLATLAAELDEQRRVRMTHNARRLAAAGHLRDRCTVQQAADILWTYSSPELYDLLVRRAGWEVSRYGSFIAAGVAAHLG